MSKHVDKNGRNGCVSFIKPKMIAAAQKCFDKFVVAECEYEANWTALSILRRSGRFDRHDQRSTGLAWDRTLTDFAESQHTLIEAFQRLCGIFEPIEIYLKSRSARDALNYMGMQPFTDVIMSAVQGVWNFSFLEGVPPVEDRRELVRTTAVALSLFRNIKRREKE